MRQHTEMINAPADSLKCINIVAHIKLEVLINLSYSFLSTFLQNFILLHWYIQSDQFAKQNLYQIMISSTKARKSRDEFWQGLEILESFSSQVSISELESRKKLTNMVRGKPQYNDPSLLDICELNVQLKIKSEVFIRCCLSACADVWPPTVLTEHSIDYVSC